MIEIRLKAKSSSGEPYEVIFIHHGDFFTVSCSCQAGVFGKLCKHKTQLLQGDQAMLYDLSEISKLTKICSWVDASKYAALLEEHSQIKKEIELAKHREQKFRRMLQTIMSSGISFAEEV